MKNKQKYGGYVSVKRDNQGFALVEVLLAALVMAVGSAAFLRLQSISFKNSSNNYGRTQATVIASDFVERLRGNIGALNLSNMSGSIVGGNIGVTDAPQKNSDCSGGVVSDSCVEATLSYQKYLTSLQMNESFPQNLSLLCYFESSDASSARGYFRITVLWRDSLSTAKTVLEDADCPNSFSDPLSASNKANSVTIYAQL